MTSELLELKTPAQTPNIDDLPSLIGALRLPLEGEAVMQALEAYGILHEPHL